MLQRGQATIIKKDCPIGPDFRYLIRTPCESRQVVNEGHGPDATPPQIDDQTEKAPSDLVRFEDVTLNYGSGPDVLRALNFHLEPGSFHFIVGSSGAGKSSLLRLMYLARKPTTGRLRLFGRDVESLNREDLTLMRRRIGVVFQEFRLLDHLTAVENVALPLMITGSEREKARHQVSELLAWVGLGEHLDAYPPTLSGGQKQRVAIARAVIGRPSLLLADEPTGSVDDRIGLRLLYLFEELNRLGTTVVIATHNETLVSRFHYPAVELRDGQLHAADPRDPNAQGSA